MDKKISDFIEMCFVHINISLPVYGELKTLFDRFKGRYILVDSTR